MDKSAAEAFVYAKASGMLAKSFVGVNITKLFSVKSLSELYSLLFPDSVPSVPEVLLAKEIEKKAEETFVSQYIKLLSNYSNPDEILIQLLRFYEFDNLKNIGAALCYKEANLPDIVDIHQYSRLKYEFWPDIKKITEHSNISWYNKIPEALEQKDLDDQLDKQYIDELYSCVNKLPSSIRDDVASIVLGEVSMNNILWALRLKVFYHLDNDAIKNKLAYIDKIGKKDELTREAFEVLNKDIATYEDWKNWRHSSWLNPHEDGVVWEIDPCWIEKVARKEFYDKALRLFHKNPFSSLVLVCWFKIKQNELDCIRTVAEGLRLDVEPNQVMDAAGFNTTSSLQ